jgi:hypothetical protein
MVQEQLFRLTRGAMAIARRDLKNAAIMIPEGAIIEILKGPFNGVRLMEVRYDAEIVLMFTDDMEHFTEPIKGEAYDAPR